ncbi:MAG: hypothetical protein KKI08_06620 [Armatimonadetes bacterium]|nr:hypothetical protein [Armatimonadota bacterium]
MDAELLWAEPGWPYEVWVLVDRFGRSQVRGTIEKAQKHEKNRFFAMVRQVVRVGPEQAMDFDFVDAKNKMWKMEVHKNIRIYCFRDGGARIILTHAIKKNRRKERPEWLATAVGLRMEYLEVRQGKTH